jgi:hypothetical protein
MIMYDAMDISIQKSLYSLTDRDVARSFHFIHCEAHPRYKNPALDP